MGHGSAYVAQVSMANAAKLYKAMLDALEYRGTAFLQCYTACQPEHGVADDLSTVEAQRVRDSRVMPEFTFHPGRGETRGEAFDLKGNPLPERDFWDKAFQDGQKYRYTPAHFAVGEQRFRRHWKEITGEEADRLVTLDDMLARITQDDVVHRRHLVAGHRAFVPDFGVVMRYEDDGGKVHHAALSRQLVLVLRRAQEVVAHAAERSRDREPRLPCAEERAREDRQGRAREGGVPEEERGARAGGGGAAGGGEQGGRQGAVAANRCITKSDRRAGCAAHCAPQRDHRRGSHWRPGVPLVPTDRAWWRTTARS
jgi:hypothetical protein